MDRESVIALINEKESTLAHYGIRGMRWGDRRYQNEDGSLTPEGKIRYGVGSNSDARRLTKEYHKVDRARAKAEYRYQQYIEKAIKKGKPINESAEKYQKTIQDAVKYREGLDKQRFEKGYSFKYQTKSIVGDVKAGKSVLATLGLNLISAPFGMIGAAQVRDKREYSTIKVENKPKEHPSDNYHKKTPLTKDEVKEFENRVTNTIGDLKNDKTYDKYVTLAGIIDSDIDATPRDILGTVSWHRHDDGEQNDHTAAAVYAREKGLSEEFEKLSDETWDLSDRDETLYFGGYGEDDTFNRDKLALFQKNTDPDFDKKMSFAKDVINKLPNLEDAYILKFNPGSEEYWDIPWSKLEPWQIAEINKQLGILKHSDVSSDFLAHYGIKGQEWGKRRFQNEDGSLTPEGRKRYGLKPDYSGLSDQELRDAINRKRTQNQYMELRTAGVRKKQQDREGLIRAASDVTGKTVKLATTGVDIQTNRKIEENKPLIEAKDPKAIEYGKELGTSLKLTKDVNKLTGNITGFASAQAGNVAKLSVHDELIQATREAREAMNELDEQELRKTVDRMLLEKQYDELVNPPKPSRAEKGREVLQTIGSIMGVALTGIMIAQGIKGLMKKKSVAQSSLNDGSEYLEHYRTVGSKNGVRRYQNEDGSLTPEGYRHYGIDPNGRQASPQEIEARARAQMKAQQEKAKMQRRIEAGGARYAQRAAIRDAKNQARIQSIYAKQDAKTQREMQKMENKSRAEDRRNLRHNIIKGVAGVAAIAGAVGVGYHFLHNRSLDLKLARDVTKINAEKKAQIDVIRAEARKIQDTNIDLLSERNRHSEANLGMRYGHEETMKGLENADAHDNRAYKLGKQEAKTNRKTSILGLKNENKQNARESGLNRQNSKQQFKLDSQNSRQQYRLDDHVLTNQDRENGRQSTERIFGRKMESLERRADMKYQDNANARAHEYATTKLREEQRTARNEDNNITKRYKEDQRTVRTHQRYDAKTAAEQEKTARTKLLSEAKTLQLKNNGITQIALSKEETQRAATAGAEDTKQILAGLNYMTTDSNNQNNAELAIARYKEEVRKQRSEAAKRGAKTRSQNAQARPSQIVNMIFNGAFGKIKNIIKHGEELENVAS